MGLTDLFTLIAEKYGLLPVYALIVGFAGVTAGSVKQLLGMLAIMAGVYVTMFRAFNLGGDLDVFGFAERFNLHPDVVNGVSAALFVFGLGFAVYGVKRLIVRKPRDA
ncbi:MAG: hypothetical protein SGJ23_02265 [Alphaproteobacteria bacterium]|nr:hypothetical protein [Alphaproteobacteria bacterium]